jgi:hypothetical protein
MLRFPLVAGANLESGASMRKSGFVVVVLLGISFFPQTSSADSAFEQDILWVTPLTPTVSIGLGGPPFFGGPWITYEQTSPIGSVAAGDQFFLSLNDPVVADIVEYINSGAYGAPFEPVNYPNDVEIVVDPGGESVFDGFCPGLVCSLGNYWSGIVLTDPGPGFMVDGVVIDVTSNSVEYGFYGISTPEPCDALLLLLGLISILTFGIWRSRTVPVTSD